MLLRVCPDEEDTIDQIVNLLVDTCSSKRRMLRVAGDDKPAEVVRSRFMKLNTRKIFDGDFRKDLYFIQNNKSGTFCKAPLLLLPLSRK